MPKNYKNRDKKLKSRKDQMVLNSRGLITITLPLLAKKAKAKKSKK